jgi:hypothetical protein
MTMSTTAAGGFGERLDLDFGQMFARPAILVLGLPRRHSSENSDWSVIGNKLQLGSGWHG